VKVTNTKPTAQTLEQDIPLEPNAVLLSEDMIGWFDLMYRLTPLTEGQLLDVTALFPEEVAQKTITISVRPELEEIDVGGVTYRVFVCDCDIPELGSEVHYVTETGLLVKIERPGSDTTKDVMIELGVEPVE